MTTALRLAAATPLPQHRLALRFADGFEATVSIADLLRIKALASLRDPAVFAKAKLSREPHGCAIEWPGGADLAADNLRNLAVEQSGGIGHERIIEWMYQHGLTQQAAADAIGVSRRMLNYYLSAAKPIPKTVWLACLGWAAQQAA
ncbi:MAG: DUF2442 domain-containing protein [Xanthomonadaceae bacterium]|nr:DUF2442 domain-containing protein [Xanthomonadaceae bacterium]